MTKWAVRYEGPRGGLRSIIQNRSSRPCIPARLPKPGDRLTVVGIGVTLKIASRPRRTRSSQLFDRQTPSMVAGRQLNSALARVALLTVCEGGEPSVNAICA